MEPPPTLNELEAPPMSLSVICGVLIVPIVPNDPNDPNEMKLKLDLCMNNFLNDPTLSSNPEIIGNVLWHSLKHLHSHEANQILELISSRATLADQDHSAVVNIVPDQSEPSHCGCACRDQSSSLHLAIVLSIVEDNSLGLIWELICHGANLWHEDHHQQIPIHLALNFLTVNHRAELQPTNKTDNLYHIVRILLDQMTQHDQSIANKQEICSLFLRYHIVPIIIQMNDQRLVQILDRFEPDFELTIAQLHFLFAIQSVVKMDDLRKVLAQPQPGTNLIYNLDMAGFGENPILNSFKRKYFRKIPPNKIVNETSVSVQIKENHYELANRHYPNLEWNEIIDEIIQKRIILQMARELD